MQATKIPVKSGPSTQPAASSPGSAQSPPGGGAGRSVFVGRQPIFDAQRVVMGYELLFRSGEKNSADHRDANQATLRTVDNTLNVIGLRELVGDKLAFVNFPRDLVLNDSYGVLPPRQTVIELLEDVVIDAELIEGCRRIKKAGFFLALDDVVFSPEYAPLLEIADLVKLDVMQSDLATCHAIVDQHRRPGLSFLAEKVETYEVFEQMRRIGCRYFQGYFFCKPEVVSAKPLVGAKHQYLRLIKELTAMPFEFGRVEETIRTEVSLSVKLLRYLNSSAVGLPQPVASIKQAMALLGEQKLKQWGSLVAVTCLSEDKPAELARVCLVRARFCELLGVTLKAKNSDLDLFLLGLLSAIDALVDRPMSEILKDLSLANDIKATLMGGSTPLGKLLLVVHACERGDFKRAALAGKMLGLADALVADSYKQAMQWADNAMGEAG